MPEAPETPEKKPGIFRRFFGWLFSLPGRFFRLPLPLLASIITAICLTVIVVTVWIMFFTDRANVPWYHSLSWMRILAVLLLLVVIPIVVHRVLRLWLEGEKSQFPDIDFAWKAGLEALRRSGLALDSVPLFLILGSTGDKYERAMMEGSSLRFRVRGVPEGPAPLHWYANPDGIYLFCTEASWLSALARVAEKESSDAPVTQLPSDGSAVEGANGGDYGDSGGDSSAAGGPKRGTIMLDQYRPPDADFSAEPAAMPASLGGGRGTMMLLAPSESAMAQPSAARTSGVIAPSEYRRAALSPQDSSEQLQRLQYVCQLLRRARAPLCAVNGILTLMPYQLIQAGMREVEELQRAAKSDLRTVQHALQLRCPVTSLIVGLESERGFRELVRRVGRDRAAVQRFGQRFDVRTPATAEQLVALCDHVCGAFEDWIYTLFREQGALARPGNTVLYSLLCKVRCRLKSRLGEVLAGGYGLTPQEQAARLEEAFPFSGCYFAATGEREESRAFIKSVFDKLVEEQEDIEWTQRALRTDRRFLWLAYTGFALDAVLAITLGVMVVRYWFW